MKKVRPKRSFIVVDLFKRYFSDHVSFRAASLAYFLLFSIFPLCILFSMVISSLQIDPQSLTNALRPFLPGDVLSTLQNYLLYVQKTGSQSLMLFSIVFSIYFPWRAVRGLMSNIRKAFRQKDATKKWTYIFRELVCTLLIPASILISLLLVLLGRNVIIFLVGRLSLHALNISDGILVAWEYIRFAIAAVIMGLALAILYHLSPDEPLPLKECVPGTVMAIAGWIGAGVLFSFYTEHFPSYSLIYGTLTAVIILMLWLYWTALIFIMGGQLNALLYLRRQEKQQASQSRDLWAEPVEEKSPANDSPSA